MFTSSPALWLKRKWLKRAEERIKEEKLEEWSLDAIGLASDSTGTKLRDFKAQNYDIVLPFFNTRKKKKGVAKTHKFGPN